MSKWFRLFKKLWRRQLLYWAGETELLDMVDMQRELITQLQDLNKVEANAYKLTIFCDVIDSTMGFKMTCVHGQQGDCNSVSKHFHSLIHNQTRVYCTDLNARLIDFNKLWEAELLAHGVEYIEDEELEED